jgi:hypothetical protein
MNNDYHSYVENSELYNSKPSLSGCIFFATSWQVMGPSPNEVTEFLFSIYLKPPATVWVDSASNRNKYQKMFLGSTAQAACKADNLTAICEPSVWTTSLQPGVCKDILRSMK